MLVVKEIDFAVSEFVQIYKYINKTYNEKVIELIILIQNVCYTK